MLLWRIGSSRGGPALLRALYAHSVSPSSSSGAGTDAAGVLPDLPYPAWRDTKDTLHLFAQQVGKLKLTCAPPQNHWWHVTLYVSPRGLTTGAVPYRDAVFDIEFDFVNHMLTIRKSDGGQEAVSLVAKPVAEFYGEALSALDRLDIETRIVGKPNEVDPRYPVLSGLPAR